MACGTLTPRLGIETVPLAAEAWNLRHWTTRGVPSWWIDFLKNILGCSCFTMLY